MPADFAARLESCSCTCVRKAELLVRSSPYNSRNLSGVLDRALRIYALSEAPTQCMGLCRNRARDVPLGDWPVGRPDRTLLVLDRQEVFVLSLLLVATTLQYSLFWR